MRRLLALLALLLVGLAAPLTPPAAAAPQSPPAVATVDTFAAPALTHWFNKRKSGAGTLAIVGDSTSDATGNASGLYSYLGFYQAGGEALNGVTILDYGSNGNTLANFIAGTAAAGKTLANLISAAPDLIVFSYGINDVRTNSATLAQMTAMVKQAINTLRAALPNTDFILRIPNTLCDDPASNATYITNGATQQGGSDILRLGYRACENQWSNVVVFDTPRDIFGETVLTLANNPNMSDALHPGNPGYSAIADGAVALLGYRTPFSPAQALRARTLGYALDYTYYPRAVEDANYYDLVATGKYISQGTGYVRFAWPGNRATEIRVGDIIVPADQTPTVCTTAGVIFNDGTTQQGTQIAQTVPTITKGTVKVYRHKYAGLSAMEFYGKATTAFAYRWSGQMTEAGSGYFRMQCWAGELPAGSRSSTTSSDICWIEGYGQLTGGSVSILDATRLQDAKSGFDFTPYLNKRVFFFGNHGYENGSRFRQPSQDSALLQAN